MGKPAGRQEGMTTDTTTIPHPTWALASLSFLQSCSVSPDLAEPRTSAHSRVGTSATLLGRPSLGCASCFLLVGSLARAQQDDNPEALSPSSTQNQGPCAWLLTLPSAPGWLC